MEQYALKLTPLSSPLIHFLLDSVFFFSNVCNELLYAEKLQVLDVSVIEREREMERERERENKRERKREREGERKLLNKKRKIVKKKNKEKGVKLDA